MITLTHTLMNIIYSYRQATEINKLRAYQLQYILKRMIDQEDRIRGVNFDGSVKLTEGVLSLQIIEYVTGNIYRFSTNTQQLASSFKQFLVIKKLQQLYEELLMNHEAFVSKDEQLIIPIEVQYRGRIEPLNVEVTLQKLIIEDEHQLNLKYLKEIERMSRENMTIDRYKERLIKFKADPNNTNFKSFDITPEKNLIKYNGNNLHTIINHGEPLSKIGIQSFRARIIKTYSKNIIFGVCSVDIRYTINNYHSPYFIGLSLSERTVLGNNKSDVAIQPVEIVEGKSMVKVEMDMNKSVISWFLDDSFLCARKIPTDIISKDVYPIISLYNLGDSVEIIG